MLLFQFHKAGCSKILEVINCFNNCVSLFEQTCTVFFLSFFAENQKCYTLDLKIGLADCIADKGCLSAVQEAVYNIDWFLFHFFISFKKIKHIF